ncbi:MAG: TonB-dependent siderophore receptor [Opitutaceae bacterium]|nr:TonB-dependent siderophore receptor [Opitutaceae bacterium]
MKNRKPNVMMFFLCGLILSSLRANEAASTAASRPEKADEPVMLDRLEVNTDRARDEGYKADRTRIATKTDTPLQDVPQSMTVVTQEQIQDQQMMSLGDVVRYVPGVSAHQGENNRDQIIFRGNSSSADFFVNGVRDDVQYYRDLYNLDRVEVLRGPNAMIFGRGGGGGVINRATKEADFSPVREVTLQGGSFGHTRAALDVDQPFIKQAAIRFNGVYENSDSFRHAVSLKRYAFNPTATFLPDKEMKFTLGYEYLHDTRTADRGITSFQGRPADVPIATFYGNPDDSHVKANVHLATGTFEHRIGGLNIRNRTVFGDYDRFYQNYVPGAVTADKAFVALTAYNNDTKRRNIFNQTDLTYEASAGNIRHTLLGGVELGRQLTGNFRNTGFFNNTATSLSVAYGNPTIKTPVIFRQSTSDADNHLKTDLAAAYIQDQIEFTRKLQAVAGLRFDSFDLQYHNHRNGDYLGRRDYLVSPRTGLVFKPLTKVSLYGNYSVSYLPSSGDQFSSLTIVTQQVKPEKFTNYEIGTKWDLPNNIFVTGALYQLDRTNTRATDPNDPTRIVQTGSQRSKGFEIGLTGRITSAWMASAGYAYQDASISSATTAARAGATVAQVPQHSFSLWNKYQFLPKLSVGLGIIRRSDMFATVDNTVTVPGHTRVDAAVFYSLNDRWRIQVNVGNLFDKKYYINADSNTNISPGSPRAIRFGMISRI